MNSIPEGDGSGIETGLDHIHRNLLKHYLAPSAGTAVLPVPVYYDAAEPDYPGLSGVFVLMDIER